MPATYGYRREDVSIIVDGTIIQGFPDGTFFSAERAESQMSLKAGTHGEVDIMSKNVTSGTIKITTMGSSQANNVLQSLKDQQDALGIRTFPVIVRDNRSETHLVFSRDAVIEVDPPDELGDERGDVEWSLLCPHLTMVKSGAVRIA